MKQHSVQRCGFPEGYVRRRAGCFTTFSLGSGNEVLSCSDHDAKLSSSRAGDSPWRCTPRQQLAWHIRPLQHLHKERSTLCGYRHIEHGCAALVCMPSFVSTMSVCEIVCVLGALPSKFGQSSGA